MQLERDLTDWVREARENEPEKRYEVIRLDPLLVRALVVQTWQGNLTRAPLPRRLDLWNHSPSGFEYGYHGSGPAQLALALLADALGDDEQAVALHQEFKRRVVANWKREANHTITAETVRSIAADIRAEHPELLPDPFVEPDADPFAAEPSDDPPPGVEWEHAGTVDGDPFAGEEEER